MVFISFHSAKDCSLEVTYVPHEEEELNVGGARSNERILARAIEKRTIFSSSCGLEKDDREGAKRPREREIFKDDDDPYYQDMLKIDNSKLMKIKELQNRRNRKDQSFIFNQSKLKDITCGNAKLKHEYINELKIK